MKLWVILFAFQPSGRQNDITIIFFCIIFLFFFPSLVRFWLYDTFFMWLEKKESFYVDNDHSFKLKFMVMTLVVVEIQKKEKV